MYRLFEVEDVIAEMDLLDVDDDIAETDEDYQIVISGWWVHIPELNLNLHEGGCLYLGRKITNVHA
ncbi:hypothetical protein [Lacrimispora sp.]|uniref:hypothetical protein n=1 Tax=Lacrimispora sp. TaxID=2719234 RepID=UPI0028A83E9F|nr:hypothetical protein [Lacrimispora sp.]